MDLSGNNIQLKSAIELKTSLQVFRHVLTELDVSYCNIPVIYPLFVLLQHQPKGVQAFFQAMIENPGMSLSLLHLNMSGNKFELVGSQELDRWFFTLKVYSKLKYLFVITFYLLVGIYSYLAAQLY